MKKIFIIIPILLIFTLIFGFFFPSASSNTMLAGDDPIDETYFIHKLIEGNIQLLGENQLIITEDELNRYIAHKMLQEDSFLSTIPHLQLNQFNTVLKEGKMIFHGYGSLFYLPVKIQVDLTPSFRNHQLQFIIDRLQITRVNIPLKAANAILASYAGLEKDPVHGNSYFTLPLDIPEEISIEAIEFEKGQLAITYQIAKEKILDQLMKNFFQFLKP